MIDFIKKYQNNKLITNLNIIALSFVFAVGINIFLIDGTDIWKELKASILDAKVSSTVNADLYLQSSWENLYLVAWKNMSDINNLSISFVYNPENVSIKELNSNIWEVVNISNNPWISSIIITTNHIKNVANWEKVIEIKTTKKINKTENLNIINANFSDTNWQIYKLTTSGVSF